MVVQDQPDPTAQRHPYETREQTHRKRKRRLRVTPAEGSDRDQRCGRITKTHRRSNGQFLGMDQCQEQVEWVEYRTSDFSHSYACDQHVTPKLEDQS